MMAPTFTALRTHQTDAGIRSTLDLIDVSALTPGELVVRTRWAGVNYKDSLAVTGRAKVLTGSPRVAGIELVGRVEHSDSDAFEAGDMVLVHGFNTGIVQDGGFSEVVRVPQAHAMRIPVGLTPYDAAVLGVPAITVAIALERFEAAGLTPAHGPIAISGATGAVGMIALGILRKAGYRTAALTRREEWTEPLKRLGADEVIVTPSISAQERPLEKARFAAAIDNVGGSVLSWLLRSLQDGGMVAAVGNASGIGFSTNVLPFILRQAQLFGVAANAPWPVRHRLWARLASDWRPDPFALQPHVHSVSLDALMGHCELQVDGRTSGRTLVAFGD